METISEAITGTLALLTVGLFGALVARKRKHLKLVVRVLDQKDKGMIDFLQDMVARGDLQPATAR